MPNNELKNHRFKIKKTTENFKDIQQIYRKISFFFVRGFHPFSINFTKQQLYANGKATEGLVNSVFVKDGVHFAFANQLTITAKMLFIFQFSIIQKFKKAFFSRLFFFPLLVCSSPYFANTFSISCNAIVDQVQINSVTLYKSISILSIQFQIAFPFSPISMSRDRRPFFP